ncbi:geranylgeranyl transferase type-2 subunit alpha [Chelonus insularis]|uniref:geranylgeranyl transferase type-2 subunit alpha n=1 Tax=Chelonus insularis TaxID=460826 RepID=UPI00158DA1B9|nr:geranylgeranyl transferase type-2 subunit alpha [Chelonus insularis]
MKLTEGNNHGRIKVRTTAEQELAKKIEREKKVVQYKAAINLIFEKRKNKIYDDELLFTTEHLVLKIPDIHTIWNIRREAFQNNQWDKEQYVERLKKELSLTENCLRENPKSYSVWYQRCWVIDHLPSPDWNTELALCAKCLNLDERNFHCWDYRQHIVKKAGISDEDEFEFSTTKILNNFSNYSSWHYRSKILSKLFPDKENKLPIDAEKHKEELDLVMNATFTDPNDSSAWFYQRWLLDYTETQPNVLWQVEVTNEAAIVIFHENTCLRPDDLSLSIKVADQASDDDSNKHHYYITNWNSLNNSSFSKVWVASLSSEKFDEKDEKPITISITFKKNTFNLTKSENSNVWYYRSSSLPLDRHNKTQLKEQLDNYKQLVQMEPNNKWAILTGIFLMKNYDFVSYHEDILKDLNLLMKIDHLRANYYADIRSKCVMDYKLHFFQQSKDNSDLNSTVDLSNLELTIFYNEHYFTLCQELNLSGNHLNYSLQRLSTLRNCQKLSLSYNNLKSIKNFPTLPNLKYLSLQGNELTNIDEVLNLLSRHKLSVLDIRDNPVWDSGDIQSQILNIYPDIELKVS